MKEIEAQQPEEVDQQGEHNFVTGYPAAQGLYDPQFERDACGMGFVVDMHGRASHDIIQKALTVVDNLTHRGAKGAEATTGDGAGMMMQIPHQFLQKVCAQAGFALPERGHYGVGMAFLSPNDRLLRRQQRHFAQIVQEEGQMLLGWRTVPTNNDGLGTSALAGEPFIQQVFIQKNNEISDQLAFERKLFVIRKRAEREIEGKPFYFASLSSRTLVYKGMLLGEQLGGYFPDLHDADMKSAIALVHSRFSTNTFPSWERAHPYRYVIHNGEINTVRGNVNWLQAREKLFIHSAKGQAAFGDDLPKVLPLIDANGSDTAMFDNCLEFLTLTGRSLPHAIMMMIPEPWEKNAEMCDAKKAFYEFHSHLMEPWDGPASIGFSDGTVVGAVLDRNGLRPSRYTITKDGLVIMASETGVVNIPAENVTHKGRLQPGRILLVDTAQGRLISDEELKHTLATAHPYREWINQHTVDSGDLPIQKSDFSKKSDFSAHDTTLTQQQQAFGYTFEDLRLIIAPMARDAQEAIGSMGDDTPLAILSDKPQPLYNYFKQLFAQVTNPPLDAIREELVTSTLTWLGAEGNLLDADPQDCRRIRLPHPILTDEQLAQLQHIQIAGFKAATLPILYDPNKGGAGLEQALDDLFFQANEAITAGANLLILSDRNVSRYQAAVPALLATAGLHHHLIRTGQRTLVSLIVESGEPREVHHFAVLFGYGADAVNPYLAYATITEIIQKEHLVGVTVPKGIKHYVKAINKGVVKTMSKMGISTIQSYRGAQIFEALGLHKSVVSKYFNGTPSRIQGADITLIAREVEMRHKAAFPERPSNGHALPPGGRFQWREGGEHHLFNPSTIHRLQHAVRENDYEAYKAYARDVNDHSHQLATLRGLFKLKLAAEPIPLAEVESVESICHRFKSGAMSYGSISKEAHESLAQAMNALGGKSNTGEGGEDPERFQDDRLSKIKQVASGRFGVTSDYLVNAEEIQIKMAQGAKPGEGGQLPGRKVYPWIAKVRHSTPGVGLISPPPHHDIYSIEDLAQLIFDLKNANPTARINVKLVSEVGVGTIAAGVAKGHADVILISGHDGGTGASPQSSIKHAGLPWELGVAEAHQTLLMNGLRDRVVVETDGQLKTGRDVIVAALLGAEEFGFATAPLVALGCIMMRVCHLDTCPVGVATQNPELRQKFAGKPEHVINFMRFVAQDMREIMAELGIRTIDELVGRTDLLEVSALAASEASHHWKLRGLNLMPILYQPNGKGTKEHLQADGRKRPQQHGLEETLDATVLLDFCQPAIEHNERVSGTFSIRNIHRTVGTMVGSAVTKRHGANGLPADSITLRFVGSAGQSFGAFVPKGMTLQLEGDANDYIGKGLSGGKIIVTPPSAATFLPEENIIVGNVAFYGATNGQAYINGVAGERFCVRNSGATAVVEGVGDHGCEYMTGGQVVVLGQTGRNFAAGMSGGVAYVWDGDGRFAQRCNREMVELEPVTNGDSETLTNLILCHAQYTDSKRAWDMLVRWDEVQPMFVKVMPRDYKNALEAVAEVQSSTNLSGEELAMAAFRQSQQVRMIG